jgi:hypothetical protein
MYGSLRILSGLGKLVHTLGLQWPEESRIGKSEIVVSQNEESSIEEDEALDQN